MRCQMSCNFFRVVFDFFWAYYFLDSTMEILLSEISLQNRHSLEFGNSMVCAPMRIKLTILLFTKGKIS
jgi:hypothetical protein